MNVKRKILVVFLSLVVFCSFTLINVSASSVSFVPPGTTFTPIFAPTSVSYTDSNYYSLTDTPLTVQFNISEADFYGPLLGYQESVLRDENGDDISYLETSLYYPTDYRFDSNLNCNVIHVPYSINLTYAPDVLTGYVLSFSDFFFDTPNISDYSGYLPRLFSLVDGNDNISSVSASATAIYFDGEDILTAPIFVSGADFESCLSSFGSRCGLYSFGCYLTDISFVVSLISSSDAIVLNGSFDSVDRTASIGGSAFVDSLSPYFEPVVINETIAPTLIESILPSLNTIWNTSLFGAFTIGQVFSACAGFALFGWILKIFNR